MQCEKKYKKLKPKHKERSKIKIPGSVVQVVEHQPNKLKTKFKPQYREKNNPDVTKMIIKGYNKQ
jgi:hypothetical protein